MFIKVNPIIDYSVRSLCIKPYYNHPKGCPNFNKKEGCPPGAKLFDKYFDLNYPVYAIYNVFDFKSHVEKMRKNPKCISWSEHQLKCLLYWQPKARKKLLVGIKEFIKEFNIKQKLEYEMVTCPEAMGINITETMRNVGIELEWPPVNVTYQIALAGIRIK